MPASNLLHPTFRVTTSTTTTPSALTAEINEAKRRFPLWFSAWLAIGHVFTALLLTPPHKAAALTVVLPLSWVTLCYLSLPADQRPSRSALFTLVLTAPMVAFFWWIPARAMYDGHDLTTFKFGFEVMAPLWAAVLAAHCHRERGWPGVIVFFGLGAIYGFILENSGIELGYFDEPAYRIYVPFANTPLCSVAGWCTIFYPSVYVADMLVARLKLRNRVVVPALLVAAAAISTDLHFDPVATKLGMWVWHPTLPPLWYGVPLVNFTSWFAAVFAVAVVYYWVTARTWTPRQRVVVGVLSIPAALTLSAALNLAAIGFLEGFDGPSWRILKTAVQTVATP
jgi:uncharacterized membrane protein